MKMLFRRFAAFVAAVILCVAAIPALADNPIQVEIDGKTLIMDVPPAMVDNRVLVPLRAIFEALGAVVDWDPATQRVVARRPGVRIDLTVGSTLAMVNGKPVTLDVAPQIVNGRTLVPVRFVSEALGEKVEWSNAARTVKVTRQPPLPDMQTALLGPGDLPYRSFVLLSRPMDDGVDHVILQGSEADAGRPVVIVGMAPIMGDTAYALAQTPCLPHETLHSRPTFGDGARVCLAPRSSGISLTLAVAWRDRVIMITIISGDDDLQFAYGLAGSLATHQLDILNKLAAGQPRPAPVDLPWGILAGLGERGPRAASPGQAGVPAAEVAPPDTLAETDAEQKVQLAVLEFPMVPETFQFELAQPLNPATAGTPYRHSLCDPAVDAFNDLCGWPRALNPKGGRPPYQFYVKGTFPAIGVKLLANGLLEGTPVRTAGGKRYPVEVCAKDLAGAEVCQNTELTVAVAAAPATPMEFSLKGEPGWGTTIWARVSAPFRHSYCEPEPAPGAACGVGGQLIQPKGGEPPYRFRLESGTLPPGLTLAENGVLSGTPAAGLNRTELNICAADSAGTEICRTSTLRINQNVQALLFQNTTWKGSFTVQDANRKNTYTGTFSFRIGTVSPSDFNLQGTDVTLTFSGPVPHEPHRALIVCPADRPSCTGFDVAFRTIYSYGANLSFQVDSADPAGGSFSPTRVQGPAYYEGLTGGTFTATRQ